MEVEASCNLTKLAALAGRWKSENRDLLEHAEEYEALPYQCCVEAATGPYDRQNAVQVHPEFETETRPWSQN
ncbi:hypothetical protein TSUD_95580 [Trifolium subterraneum]|uniref:Uncharacterized protein n=1 Tax=Trifolium subterraneum TaxID=3900 RepID=A0A2Z6MCT0_TRISU|nr:hypothetical protein TSUD_95580 [Trifolium subterraneum]